MEKKPVFKRIAQVGLVVKDLDAALRKHWEEYGMGPWSIYTFDPSTVSDMIVRGKRVDHAMRLAFTTIDNVMWELIQPLDDKSIYAEHIEEHGEGMHHILFEVEDYDDAVAHFRKKGLDILQGGNWHGMRYAYFDTTDSLCAISEISSPPQEGVPFPAPEATYP